MNADYVDNVSRSRSRVVDGAASMMARSLATLTLNVITIWKEGDAWNGKASCRGTASGPQSKCIGRTLMVRDSALAAIMAGL